MGKSNKTTATETPDPTKAKKFVELAEKRVNTAIHALRGIGKLANTASYEYTPDQVQKIADVLSGEFERIASAFNTGKAPTEAGFKL